MADEIKAIKSDKGNVTEIPLMWTIYGNRPVASCNCDCKWSEDEKAIYCKLFFYDKKTHELVREDSNVYLKKGVAVKGKQAKI